MCGGDILVKNIKYIFKVCLIMIFIFSFILANIISDDAHCMDHCENEHCIKCIIIQVAHIVVNNILAIVVLINYGFLIYFFLSRIDKEKIYFIHTTLVNQKVQLNE